MKPFQKPVSKKAINRSIFLIFLILFLSSCLNSSSDLKKLGTVSFKELTQRVTVRGFITPRRKTFISAPYSGYIKRIYVQVGQKIQAGDPIISITQSLRNPTEEIYPMRSPFDGTVMQILKTEGEYVDQVSYKNQSLGGFVPGNALVRIDDLSKLFVEAIAPEIEIDKIKQGQEVTISSSALLGRTYQGIIQTIFLAANAQGDFDKSKTEFSLMIQFLKVDAHLKPGMSVIVDIITQKISRALVLRHEFIQKKSDQYWVTLQDGTQKKIEVGIQNEDFFEIRSGLKEGEKVHQTDFLNLTKGQSL